MAMPMEIAPATLARPMVTAAAMGLHAGGIRTGGLFSKSSAHKQDKHQRQHGGGQDTAEIVIHHCNQPFLFFF